MMKVRYWLLLTVGFGGQLLAEEKEMWYGADGEPIRAVSHSESTSDTWQPQWVDRERAQANPTHRRRGGYELESGWYGDGIYVGRSIYVPRHFYGHPRGYAGYRNYGHRSGGGFSGFYSRHNGHSHWGASYRRPGFQLHYRR